MMATSRFRLARLFLALALALPVWAEEAAEKEAEEKEPKTLAETVANFEQLAGFFTLYRDPEKGELFMEVSSDQLGREFVYFRYAENGVVAASAFRGAYRGEAVLHLQRYFDRIEFVQENTRFYFDPENPLARAADANISPAVLAVSKIVAKSEDDARVLIKLDDVLLTESLHRITPRPDPEKKAHEQFSLGKLSKEKTRYRQVRVYPKNVNVQVNYVYANEMPYIEGGDEVTDPRAVTVTLQHSFVEIPDNNYRPRIDDARVGYFYDEVTDLTSHKVTPYRDLINRWHLEKKDPEAELSEPVEPIVWWIENTTPHAYRDAIRDGVLAWNEAFEQAGFKDAIVVKVQPDDADWDAGDIRYNVLRWTSSPQPPFGGYGPSFTNPRTGQILGSDIMLEDVFVSNRVRYSRIYDGAQLPFEDQYAGQAGKFFCGMQVAMQADFNFAKSAIGVLREPEDLTEMVRQGLEELALHEVGHTLGLNHNMRASQLWGNDEIHDADITQGVLTGSVMDYAPTNIAPPSKEQGDYYITRPGPYDVWAIQFGYDPDLEGDSRAAHLARSVEPELAFGNDADDMRAAGRAIDPRVMVNDLSSDAIAYAADRFDTVKMVLAEIKDKLMVEGESYAEIHNAYRVLVRQQRNQARVVSRYIGGVQVERGVVGTMNVSPYTPIPEDWQRQAMGVLNDYVFGPSAFAFSSELVSHLAQQRRGFEFFGKTEDPKVHDHVLAIQKDVLDHLLHPVVLQRLTDTTLYGNNYDVDAVLHDLTEAIFSADLSQEPASFRRALQVEYVQRLLKLLDPADKGEYDPLARAAAFTELNRIDGWMKKHRRHSQAPRDYIAYLIQRGLDKDT